MTKINLESLKEHERWEARRKITIELKVLIAWLIVSGLLLYLLGFFFGASK